MRRRLFTIVLAFLTVGLLGSCSKINERIDGLDKRVYELENGKIASVDQQIAAINVSITNLKAAEETINGKITELKTAAQAHQTLIDALKEADKALGQKDTELEARIATLEGQVTTINGQIATLEDADKAINLRIDSLKTYVNTEIGKTKDWAEETFATLGQYQQTADDLAALSVTVTGISTTLTGVQTSISGLDTKIDGIDAALQEKITTAKTELDGEISDLKKELEGKIADAIRASETSIKTWINKLLEGYYTAAVVDEKIDALNTAIEAAKDTAKTRIDSVATELTELKKVVDKEKATIRTEYKNAIDVAINKLDGEIRGALLDSIAAVNGRIEALDTRVTTLELKMQAVEGRVDKLEAAIGAYTELQGTITEIIKMLLAEVGDKPQSEQDTTIWKCITALQAQCGTLSTAIQTLQGLVGNKDVATQISEAIAALVTTQKLEGLADAVSALKDIVYGKGDVKSLTQQIADINEKLSTTYVTKTQLGQDIATAKADLQKQIDSLCNVIGKDGTAETATGIFKKIADLNARVAALEAVNITIGTTNYTNWSEAVQAVLDKVDALEIGDIDGLEATLDALESRLDRIEAMIQAVSIIPAYTDGSLEAFCSFLAIDCIVEPFDALTEISADSVTVLISKAKTKAASYEAIAVSKLTKDPATGILSIKADISSVTPAPNGMSLMAAVRICSGISHYVTGFYPVYTKSNVDIAEDGSGSTKVTISADADFPDAVRGVLPVESSFVSTKPTTIQVEGIGTITFDEQAVEKIKENAGGATNVIIKVEDVTNTLENPVPDADIVLEITMKTFDETGTEVFSEDKAAGKVTVSIPLEEDVVYIKTVTLVNDNGEPIVGGVIPETFVLDLEKHILSFQVEHFSKYAIGYVKQRDFVSVTDVTLNKGTLTLPISGTETLVATVAPDNATNNKVSWTSTNPSIATVDKNGKVTAVAKGEAKIIVTTEDVVKATNKPASDTCVVTVVVPVTGVSLDKTSITLAVGGTETLIATVAPGDAANKNVSWSSSDTTVATVDENGTVTAVGHGTATITVTTEDGSKTATCDLTVTTGVGFNDYENGGNI